MLYVMEWLPMQTSHKTISLFSPASSTKNPHMVYLNVNNMPSLNKILIPLPYVGKHGVKLANSFIRKITPLLKSQCKIIINWQTTDTNSFVSLKDPTPKQYKSSIVYEFKCPGCNANYIGKTDHSLPYTRIKEHSSQNTSEIYHHIITCNDFNYIKNILQLTPYDDTNINCTLTDLIFTNTTIIDKSIAINRYKPTLNHGTKALKELLIFN